MTGRAISGPAAGTPQDEGTERGEPADATPAPRRRRRHRADVACVLGLVLLSFAITLLGVVRATSLSAFDEASHIDYAWGLAEGRLPYAGSTMAPEVLREWSCRSQEGVQFILPPCEGTFPAADYPVRGENYNFGHPPVYYAITAAAASLGDALPIGLTFVTSARLTGAAWLAAALAGLYLVLRQWRVPRLMAVSAAAVLAAVPAVAHASSIVTNDAPAPLVGVLALWVLTRVAVQDRLGWLLPTAVAFAAASTKVLSSVAMLSVAVVVLGMAVVAFRAGETVRARALGLVSVGMVGATGLVYAGWSAFQARRGEPGWTNPVEGINTDPVVGLPVGEWLPTFFSTFGLTEAFWLQAAVSSWAVVASGRGLAVLLTAAPFAVLAAFAAGDPRRLVGWAALAGAAMVPPLVQVQVLLMFGDFFPRIAGRYGISLVPLTIAALVLVAHARGWRAASVVVGISALGALLLTFGGVL